MYYMAIAVYLSAFSCRIYKNTNVLRNQCGVSMLAGSIILYVVNHRSDEGVDKFKYDPAEPKKLKHEGRIANESAFERLDQLLTDYLIIM